MNNKKTFFIVMIVCLELCYTPPELQRIGYFHRIENKVLQPDKITVEEKLLISKDCFISITHYGFDDDYINKNLEKMINGNSSILGFRDLKIEYKFYLISIGIAAGYLSIDCITFSGYPIYQK